MPTLLLQIADGAGAMEEAVLNRSKLDRAYPFSNSCRVTARDAPALFFGGRGSTDGGLYLSPFESFLNEYKSTHPGVDRRQMDGRALLWEKLPYENEATAEPYGSTDLRQPGYVYYGNVR
jgi:hypothetical protein